MSCYCAEDDHNNKEFHFKKKDKIFSNDHPKKLLIHDNPPHHFSKPHCIFHPPNEITNFCINPSCFMPLCPACMENHLLKHEGEISSESHIRTFEQVMTASLQQLHGLQENLRFHKRTLKNPLIFPSESPKFHAINELNQLHAKVYALVDGFFNEVARDLETRFGAPFDENQAFKEIKNRNKEIKRSLEAISQGGQKALKQLILLNNNKFYHDNMSFLEGLSMRGASAEHVRIEENPIELTNIRAALQRYAGISYRNGEFLRTEMSDFSKKEQKPMYRSYVNGGPVGIRTASIPSIRNQMRTTASGVRSSFPYPPPVRYMSPPVMRLSGQPLFSPPQFPVQSQPQPPQFI